MPKEQELSLREQFKKAHPETLGEKDKAFDDLNYITWLEEEVRQLHVMNQSCFKVALENQNKHLDIIESISNKLQYQINQVKESEIKRNGVTELLMIERGEKVELKHSIIEKDKEIERLKSKIEWYVTELTKSKK